MPRKKHAALTGYFVDANLEIVEVEGEQEALRRTQERNLVPTVHDDGTQTFDENPDYISGQVWWSRDGAEAEVARIKGEHHPLHPRPTDQFGREH